MKNVFQKGCNVMRTYLNNVCSLVKSLSPQAIASSGISGTFNPRAVSRDETVLLLVPQGCRPRFSIWLRRNTCKLNGMNGA